MAPSSPSHQRPVPRPVETTKRVQRRFAPEQSPDDARPAQSRMLPQPVESTARSTRKHNATSDVTSSPRRDSPQPMDSTASSSMSPKSRKFAPQLVETTSRQRKRGDTLPAVLDSDKTEHSADDPIYLPRHLRIPRPPAVPIPPANSPLASSDQVPQLLESKFSYASLSKRVGGDKPDRRHSFRVPELPSIPSQTEESEDSDDSTCPSLSTTPSAGSDEIEWIKNKKDHNGTRTGYLLSLAAQAAEKQLREQAMAAYPNEHSHEPVDHFAIDREDDSDKEGEGVGLLARSVTYPAPAPGCSGSAASSSRRESHAGWDVTEMRAHKDNLERQRKEYKDKDQPAGVERNRSIKESAKESHHHHRHHQRDHDNNHDHEHHRHDKHRPSRPENHNAPRHVIGGQQKDDQMKPMTKAASPPMAGQNLKFPKCQSPRPTRLDVGQYPGSPCHLGDAKSREHSGLWTPQGGPSRQNSTRGLWMGVCALSAQKPHSPAMLQTGLLTPAIERDDPFASIDQTSTQQLPPSPPTSIGGSSQPSCLNTVLCLEKSIEDEFHDGFVTQVYNYLSLGYPALARKYDHELSKISRIPIVELRQDDANVNAKGYVGAPEGTGCELRAVQEGQCGRWTALKLYIREWARQQPSMGMRDGAANEDWGARARKGSWAI